MTDPTFTNRADLEAWAGKTARDAESHRILGERTATLEAVARIKRVTLAHTHLQEEEKNDASLLARGQLREARVKHKAAADEAKLKAAAMEPTQ